MQPTTTARDVRPNWKLPPAAPTTATVEAAEVAPAGEPSDAAKQAELCGNVEELRVSLGEYSGTELTTQQAIDETLKMYDGAGTEAGMDLVELDDVKAMIRQCG